MIRIKAWSKHYVVAYSKAISNNWGFTDSDACIVLFDDTELYVKTSYKYPLINVFSSVATKLNSHGIIPSLVILKISLTAVLL